VPRSGDDFGVEFCGEMESEAVAVVMDSGGSDGDKKDFVVEGDVCGDCGDEEVDDIMAVER
jgi:hypothetical protein